MSKYNVLENGDILFDTPPASGVVQNKYYVVDPENPRLYKVQLKPCCHRCIIPRTLNCGRTRVHAECKKFSLKVTPADCEKCDANE